MKDEILAPILALASILILFSFLMGQIHGENTQLHRDQVEAASHNVGHFDTNDTFQWNTNK